MNKIKKIINYLKMKEAALQNYMNIYKSCYKIQTDLKTNKPIMKIPH